MAEEVKEPKEKKDEKGETKPVKKNAASLMTKDEPKKPVAKDSSGKSEKSAGKKKKTHKFHHTMVEHHSDGSHTVRHVPEGGGQEVSYAAPDLNGVTAGLQQNLGGGQAEPPASAPTPAPAPAPAAGGAAPVVPE